MSQPRKRKRKVFRVGQRVSLRMEGRIINYAHGWPNKLYYVEVQGGQFWRRSSKLKPLKTAKP